MMKVRNINLYEPYREQIGPQGFPTRSNMATEDGWRLEILDLGSRGIVLSV